MELSKVPQPHPERELGQVGAVPSSPRHLSTEPPSRTNTPRGQDPHLGCATGAARPSFAAGTQTLALPSSKCHLDENPQAHAREVSVFD